MWVIIRMSDGKYVARSGSEHSYTEKLEEAATFNMSLEAKNNSCNNEFVQSVESVLANRR